ncbi:hypothetical protein C2857_003153 [Epichloe festucae Fl1]|uniref:Uncharacterized protein n=1 Tax=Epichloe festucae (strain Fl1) TaxID=877507 RepID=A0A7S9KKD4_EPIFF|nr:hypothetical protein C2857_003153 [Epichloe festucae Fl1]
MGEIHTKGSLPFFEVSHLPSSSSFFASVLQPLGLLYIESKKSTESSPSIIFGASQIPVLEVRQVDAAKRRRSRMLLSAPSKSAVTKFLAQGIRAYPHSIQSRQKMGDSDCQIDRIRASLLDMDGNRIDAVYHDLGNFPEVPHELAAGSCRPANYQSGHVIDWDVSNWNHEFASSSTSSLEGLPAKPSNIHLCPPMRDDRGTLGTATISTVIGTLFGLAAGAAIAYTTISKREDQRPYCRQGTSLPSPDDAALPGGIWANGMESRNNPIPIQSKPFRNVPSQRPSHRRKRSQNESSQPHISLGTMTRTRPTSFDKHAFAAQNFESVSQQLKRPGIVAADRSNGFDSQEADERKGRMDPSISGSDKIQVSQVGKGQTPEKHSREAGQDGFSIPLVETFGPSDTVLHQSQGSADNLEQETYVSARSRQFSAAHRITTGVHFSQLSVPDTTAAAMVASGTPIRASDSIASSRCSARRIPLPLSIPSSGHAPARFVPLPKRTSGSNHARWDDDGDSIVPSDSISCVGQRV